MSKPALEPNLINKSPQEWQTEYERVRPQYALFTGKLEILLHELLQAEAIEFHLIEGRTKDALSFGEKITRASKAYSNPLEELTDFSGLRIITYYQSDVDAICKLIEKEFLVDAENSAHGAPVPAEFGYKSVHYVISMKSSRGGLLEWKSLSKLKAEIQVRTVLQHGWAAISHKLQYKREEDVPVQLRRKLFRLSALFELADDEFVSLRDAAENLTKVVDQRLASGDTQILLDSLSIGQFISSSPLVHDLSKIAAQAGFGLYSGASEVSTTSGDLVGVSANMGIKDINGLDLALSKTKPWAKAYLNAQFAANRHRTWGGTPGFICVLLLIGSSPEKFSEAWMAKHGWSSVVAARVKQVATSFKEERDARHQTG